MDALAHALAQRAPKVNYSQVASFYAGRPVNVKFASYPEMHGYEGEFDPNNPNMVKLSPDIRRSLESMSLPQNAVMGLTTLLHEAARARGITTRSAPGMNAQDYGTVQALSIALLPDLLQRFYGMKIGSPQSNAYVRQANQLYPQTQIPKPYQWTNALTPVGNFDFRQPQEN